MSIWPQTDREVAAFIAYICAVLLISAMILGPNGPNPVCATCACSDHSVASGDGFDGEGPGPIPKPAEVD